MKNPLGPKGPSFDGRAINETIRRALASAGLDTRAGPMLEATETIRRALAAGGVAGKAPGWASETNIDVQQQPGSFEAHAYANDAGSRTYKVYVPAAESAAPPAMIVMLHGCTQSADDFAAGTRMNRLADEHGFIVVYPEQATHANPSRCWNWFKPEDQMRGAGEPSLLAGIVREVAQRHGADPRRIFVAGLSAGAAMAVVLGQTYPELFAGVGAHSGLPYRSAHDTGSALAAMKGGGSATPGQKPMSGGTHSPPGRDVPAVPTIVFHGDRDHTVQQINSARIVQQAQDAYAALGGDAQLSATTLNGLAPGGRRFSRTVYADADGQTWIENWTVHGAGHAWSGGDPTGSYTDATGPDASAEMLRFFLACQVMPTL